MWILVNPFFHMDTKHMARDMWNVLIHMWTQISPCENRIISHVNWMWRFQRVKFSFSHINYVFSLFSHRHMKSCEMILFTCGFNIFERVVFLKYKWKCPHRNIFTCKLQTFTCYWLFVTCGHKTWHTKSVKWRNTQIYTFKCELCEFTCKQPRGMWHNVKRHHSHINLIFHMCTQILTCEQQLYYMWSHWLLSCMNETLHIKKLHKQNISTCELDVTIFTCGVEIMWDFLISHVEWTNPQMKFTFSNVNWTFSHVNYF